MKIALASKKFFDNDLDYNTEIIISTIDKLNRQVDLIIFGESFLQGFNSLTWDINTDLQTAITIEDTRIKLIQNCAKRNNVAVSFGYFEQNNKQIFSSQVTIDKNGQILDNFRRVSIGWKEPFADSSYREGDYFRPFVFMNKKIAIGLCGDLWYDENVSIINGLSPDLVIWPVYCDYADNEWNTSIKYEYAEQAGKICDYTLLVNSVCTAKTTDEYSLAKGGALYCLQGKIVKELPAGEEGVLIIEFPSSI